MRRRSLTFWILLLALTHVLAAVAGWRLRGPGAEPNRWRGRGDLVAATDAARTCAEAVYRGPRTRLYSNRPYATAARVGALVGLHFCRGERHGSAVWPIEVLRPTTLFALASQPFDLERGGWELRNRSARVPAAGASFDRLYARAFAPGRYVIRQGFSRTALPVFWSAEDVRPAR